MTLQGHRARPDRYSANDEMKKCTGFLHKENPVMLPLSHFFTLKSGRWAGRPMAECKACWRARLGRDPASGLVSAAEVNLVLGRLVALLGSKAEIGRRLKKPPSVLSRNRKHMTVRLFSELQGLLAELERANGMRGRTKGVSHAEIVDPEPLGQLVRDFIKKWRKERPISHIEDGTSAWGANEFVGALDYLYANSGIDQRKIRGIVNNEYSEIGDSIADALLQAMNLTHLMHDGTIQSRPNPRWSMEAYLAYMRERGCI